MWLGPPSMNRKMTFFAFAGNCAALAASGLHGARRSSRAPSAACLRADRQRQRAEAGAGCEREIAAARSADGRDVRRRMAVEGSWQSIDVEKFVGFSSTWQKSTSAATCGSSCASVAGDGADVVAVAERVLEDAGLGLELPVADGVLVHCRSLVKSSCSAAAAPRRGARRRSGRRTSCVAPLGHGRR